ncbi:MAG TPA: Wzz/FepE/Etk N-terminal domain-containing protein, partial [Aquihabitans sp.]|nr:Wzz/FepE/Etk N-terminal domain-containing protein [Aquihabitans sp.]
MTELESGFRLTDLLGLLRRRSAIVLAAAILGLIAGYVVFSSAPPKYSATSRVQVQPFDDDLEGGGDVDPVDIATEQDLVKSDDVGDAVREELGLEGDNRSLFRSLTVTANEDSLVL